MSDMPVTLSQAAQNTQTDYDATVIDDFRTNPLFDMSPERDCFLLWLV